MINSVQTHVRADLLLPQTRDSSKAPHTNAGTIWSTDVIMDMSWLGRGLCIAPMGSGKLQCNLPVAE